MVESALEGELTDGSFEPKIVPKRTRRLSGVGELVSAGPGAIYR